MQIINLENLIGAEDSKRLLEKRGCYKISIKGRYYIGSTSTTFRKRMRSHLECLKRKQHANPILQACVNKYGIESLEIELFPYDNEILKEEQNLIDQNFGHEKCMNISKSSSSPMLGRKHSEKSRLKLSVASKKRAKEIGERSRIIWTGRKHSDDTLEKLRVSALTRDQTNRIASLQTQHHREKISKLMTGRKMSEDNREKSRLRFRSPEHIAKTAEFNRNCIRTKEEIRNVSIGRMHGRKYIFINQSLIVEPISLRSFCMEYKLNRKEIRKLMNGVRKDYKGWSLKE